MHRPRLLLADDHRIVVEGLKRLLEDSFELVGVAEDGRSLLAAARRLKPDVIVTDISMPSPNGLEVLQQLRKEGNRARVVVLSMHEHPAYARRALAAGASGYVLKHAAPAELLLAIEAALRGQTFVTPALAGELMAGRGDEPPPERLTPRQREILRLLADGRSAKQVAEALSISPRTVEFHKYQIMETHGLRSSAELVHLAIRQGIVEI
jgi:DNA-binding NarL/FixJ family response regulator